MEKNNFSSNLLRLSYVSHGSTEDQPSSGTYRHYSAHRYLPGSVTVGRQWMETIITEIEPVMKTSHVGIEFLVGGHLIFIYAWQVQIMLARWPWKKVGVFHGFE